MEKIIETGVVISEYATGTCQINIIFLKEICIINAFSKKILIEEASENSGTLITAKYVKE